MTDHKTRQAQPPTQLWASNVNLRDPAADKITVVDALRAALAVPGVVAPVRVSGSHLRHWIDTDMSDIDQGLDLIDGALVRQNPLPALLDFLSQDKESNREIARKLRCDPCKTERASVHLIYGVPVRAKDPARGSSEPDRDQAGPPDVVTAIQGGIRLARRRDSRLEVWRTNHISRVERQIKPEDAPRTRPQGDRQSKFPEGVFPIFVDEVAPDEELIHENPLKPKDQDTWEHIAAGWRKTLSVLYKDRLSGPRQSCPAFLRRAGANRLWKKADLASPGLEEICSHCTQVLTRPQDPPTLFLPPTFSKPVERKTLAQRFPCLTGQEPRIIFAASGGVFRGAFHIGMLAAFVAQHIRPDLIIGASVGTLMGAALGSMYLQRNYAGALGVLSELTGIFLAVDSQVALTKMLKSAARDLGQRGRAVNLSPNQLRRMVERGSVADPGFAATGAPPAFIDAVSNLFLIPHRATADITAKFVAGSIEDAVRDFLVKLRTETIVRLGIRDAIIGDDLIEISARKLYGAVPPNEAQPFHRDGGNPQIAFFATAVNLSSELVTILGADLPHQHGCYDFIHSTLASSAFPGVFPAVRDAHIYRGLGNGKVYFGDGGMFDNLPFAPAWEILGEVQANYRAHAAPGLDALEFLKARAASPDLLWVGSLAARQKTKADFRNIFGVWERGTSLGDNEKIDHFREFLDYTYDQADRLSAGAIRGEVRDDALLDRMVTAAMLPVFPTDADHLNGTFHFCRSLGFHQQDVQSSIADGCFRTLGRLAKAQMPDRTELEAKSIDGLMSRRRLPRIEADGGSDSPDGFCPFFKSSTRPDGDFQAREVSEFPQPKRFECPFHAAAAQSKNLEVQQIHITCRTDEEHWKQLAAWRASDSKEEPKAKAAAASA